MSTQQLIDVHCHLFNAQFAIKEYAAISWDWMRGRYPYAHTKSALRAEPPATPRTLAAPGPIEGLNNLIAYITRLAKIATLPCQKSFDYVTTEHEKSLLRSSEPIILTPLMMDIYFCLDNNEREFYNSLKPRQIDTLTNEEPVESFSITSNDDEEYRQYIDKLRLSLRDIFVKNGIDEQASDCLLESAFEGDRSESLSGQKSLRAASTYPGVHMTPGYQSQIEDLLKLQEQNRETVFPFLAVDPRRRGVLSLIQTLVNPQTGPFKGIKLYPPLGYLPTHPNLVPVFEYCEQMRIPITVHCSRGGMENNRWVHHVWSTDPNLNYRTVDFRTHYEDKSTFYTHPGKWLPVLTRWRDLRINFSHFGGGVEFSNGDRSWMDCIICILKQYPHTYTDLSYYVKPGLLDQVKTIVAENSRIKDRIMFGTDHVMIMAEKDLGNLRNYYNNFAGMDSDMACDNARRFLSL